MTVMSRRALLANILPGAIAAAGVATVGLSLMPNAVSAMPAGVPNPDQMKPDSLVQKTQWHYHGWHRGPVHRRGRRRWVCWWHRGRQVCGWR